MKTIIPPFLKPGDTIAIAATARSVGTDQLQAAVQFMEMKGFKVRMDDGLFAVENQFAGDEVHRAACFNRLLADPDVKAIWCGRGGYGTARMVDLIDFDLLSRHPKWIAGFSDVTVLLNHVYRQCHMATLHSTMPVFMHAKTGKDFDDVCLAADSLASALSGKFPVFGLQAGPAYNNNSFSGEITGGNLSVLYSVMGSATEVDWNGKILFLEDLDEYYYHIDRMMLALRRAGKLSGLKALLVGSFIAMHDHTVPFGYNVEEIILQHCQAYAYPIVFNVNSGHHLQNIAIPFGVHAEYNQGILTFANP